MWWLWKQVKLIRGIWKQPADPPQWALSVALGMLLGLIPKGNLTAVVVTILVLSIRVHLGVTLLAALAVSFVAGWLDPLTGTVGNVLLGTPSLRPFWERLHRLPLVPWLRWNNTVVLGSLVVGGASAVPLYHIVLRVARRWSSNARSNDRVLALPAPAQLSTSEPCDPLETCVFPDAMLLPLPDVSNGLVETPPPVRRPARRAG